jgi:hypothetical protein
MKKIRGLGMRRIVVHVVTIFVGAILPTMVWAQETLSFKEAVKIGLQNNVTLNQQRQNLLQSQVQKTSRIAS